MGDIVSKVVEPPVLISKILTFVLATSVVVLGALVFTLIKMIPLERPEVFFLWTPTRAMNVTIVPMNPDTTNKTTMNQYKEGFIREYIIARNTLQSGTGVAITRNNWNSVIKPWSGNKVFSDFANTRLYKTIMFNRTPLNVSCSVDFFNTNKESAVVDMRDGWYQVNFAWICKNENIGGQITKKNYKIQIRIQSELEKKISGVVDDLEKLRKNPLGIRVVDYVIKSGNGDPLDSDIKSW